MTSRAGEPFTTDGAAADIRAHLSAALPPSGPTTSEGEPATGEWTVTRGEGFVLLPLWESAALTGVYGRAWNDAEAAAEAHLTALVTELDRRWGPHRTVSMRAALFAHRTGDPLPEPFHTLTSKDCHGDLRVWGPLHENAPATPRWVAVSLNQSDGDAPFIMTALISDRPIKALDAPA